MRTGGGILGALWLGARHSSALHWFVSVAAALCEGPARPLFLPICSWPQCCRNNKGRLPEPALTEAIVGPLSSCVFLMGRLGRTDTSTNRPGLRQMSFKTHCESACVSHICTVISLANSSASFFSCCLWTSVLSFCLSFISISSSILSLKKKLHKSQKLN